MENVKNRFTDISMASFVAFYHLEKKLELFSRKASLFLR